MRNVNNSFKAHKQKQGLLEHLTHNAVLYQLLLQLWQNRSLNCKAG